MIKEQDIRLCENSACIDKYLKEIFVFNDVKKIFLVCGNSFDNLQISKNFFNIISDLKIEYVRFSNFCSNPEFDDIIKGVDIYKNSKFDVIVGIGGGSAIDVAKCIKILAFDDNIVNRHNNKLLKNSNIPLVTIPTTAGTGSESTSFAVLYENNKKISIENFSILPNYVLLIPSLICNLPMIQKKSTLLDAFCQAFESYWSICSTDVSKQYSKKAIELFFYNDDYKKYIDGSIDKQILKNIMQCANNAGKAINIAKTTAPHAMSYILTKKYNIPHGFAVALGFLQVLYFSINNYNKCIDNRGIEYFKNIICELCRIFNVDNDKELYKKIFNIFYNEFCIENIKSDDSVNDIEMIVNDVNVERLKNNPILLSKDDIKNMYRNIII